MRLSPFRVLLASTLVVSLGWARPAPGQTAAKWEVARAPERTRLQPAFDDWDAVRTEFVCEDTPPDYGIGVYAPDELWPHGKPPDGKLFGWALVEPGPTEPLEWTADRVMAVADVERATLEALDARTALELRIEWPGGETFELRIPPSEELASALTLFLDACERHVRRANRRFELDGIRVELQIEVEDRDLADIRALAAEVGIEDIEAIFVGWSGLPVSTLQATVTSRSIENGDGTLKRSLRLWHEDWSDRDPGENVRGSWHTGPRWVTNLDRWSLRDGDWTLEARLGPGVSVEVAMKILTAIRDGTLVDVREGPSFALVGLPTRDDLQEHGHAIPSVRVDTVGGAPDESATVYEVSLPTRHLSGKTLRVRIVEDRVEVLSAGIWVV